MRPCRTHGTTKCVVGQESTTGSPPHWDHTPTEAAGDGEAGVLAEESFLGGLCAWPPCTPVGHTVDYIATGICGHTQIRAWRLLASHPFVAIQDGTPIAKQPDSAPSGSAQPGSGPSGSAAPAVPSAAAEKQTQRERSSPGWSPITAAKDCKIGEQDAADEWSSSNSPCTLRLSGSHPSTYNLYGRKIRDAPV